MYLQQWRPAVYLISAHPEPTCAHSNSGPRASSPVQSLSSLSRPDDAFMTFPFCGDLYSRSASGTGLGARPPSASPSHPVPYQLPIAPFPISVPVQRAGSWQAGRPWCRQASKASGHLRSVQAFPGSVAEVQLGPWPFPKQSFGGLSWILVDKDRAGTRDKCDASSTRLPSP